MLESAFSTKVLRLLRADIIGHWRKNPASAFAASGVADIIGCVQGRYIEVELKAPGKYAHPLQGCTVNQLHHGTEIKMRGGIWVCGDDYAKISEELREKLL